MLTSKDSILGKKSTHLYIVLMFSLLAAILFLSNGTSSLWDQDEAAYAGFGKRMLETKDYITPHYTWSDVHRKTPLHFWLIAVSYKLFGVNEFAVRFFSALSILLVYLLIFLYGKRWLHKREALLSSVVLGTSIFIPAIGKIAVTDGLLLLFQTLAGFALIEVLRTKSSFQVALFWFAIAMGVLVKGPPILIFAGFMILFLFIFHKNRRHLIRLHPWFFGWIALLPLYFWGRAAWQVDDGEFIRWLIDWYILIRAKKSVFSQTGPPGYFVASFILFFMPYLFFLPSAFVRAFKSFHDKKSPTFLLLVWLVAGWLFYEFMKSKLPAYAVAAHPAIAMLIGVQMYDFIQREPPSLRLIKAGGIAQLILSAILWIGAIGVVIAVTLPDGWLFQKFIIVTVPLLFFAGSVISFILLSKGKRVWVVRSLIVNATLFILLVFTVLIPTMDDLRNNTQKVAQYIASNPPVEKIVIANGYAKPPSLPFYLELMNPNTAVEEDYKVKSLVAKYESDTSYAFILTKARFERMRDTLPETKAKVISSFNSGKDGKNPYFVVFNRVTP